jgi:hypothetical protein
MWRLTPAVKRDDADDFGIAEPDACALYATLGASLSGRRVTRQNRTPASFTRTNHLELEIGFGDPEYLAASLFAFSATFEIYRDDRICRQGSCQNSGRRRDSLTMNTI